MDRKEVERVLGKACRLLALGMTVDQARTLAAGMMCEKGPTITPCGECESCEPIKDRTATDVDEWSLDEIQLIGDDLMYPPARLALKVFILDITNIGPHQTERLLKLLREEFPPYGVLILIAPTATDVRIRNLCTEIDTRPS